jgi:hypothetical protein
MVTQWTIVVSIKSLSKLCHLIHRKIASCNFFEKEKCNSKFLDQVSHISTFVVKFLFLWSIKRNICSLILIDQIKKPIILSCLKNFRFDWRKRLNWISNLTYYHNNIIITYDFDMTNSQNEQIFELFSHQSFKRR